MAEVTTAARALKDALKFTDEDLAANREGKLSEAQKHRLAQRSLIMLAMTIAAAILFYWSYASLPDAGGGSASSLSIWAMPVALALLAFGGFELFSAFVKLQRNSVSVTSGRAEIEVDPSRRRLFGKLKVNKFEMYVPKQQLAAFHQGDTYAIYYTTYPKQVLSAEFLN